MTEEQVIEKLLQGWELANRGRGWWISEPHIPYRRTESHRIEDSVVSSLAGAIIFLLIVNTVARTRPDLAGPVDLVVATLTGGELYGNRN